MKKGIKQSDSIREFISKNPGLRGSEIVAKMKEAGTLVSAPLVYQVLRKSASPKAKPKKKAPQEVAAAAKKPGKKRGRKPGTAKAKAVPVTTRSSVDLFSATQDFVNAAGSLEKAIEILSVFKR
jgi:hypothetical protein